MHGVCREFSNCFKHSGKFYANINDFQSDNGNNQTSPQEYNQYSMIEQTPTSQCSQQTCNFGNVYPESQQELDILDQNVSFMFFQNQNANDQNQSQMTINNIEPND
eukprot:CAMPEP_0116931248 /NCGR_PEP_ID=MMETSP0467-20121206/27698_1 /TAXON_ID=283647 /ORGANISM="Mesodinium pulex, Strain SPMC105" /LENGTH=105 /DNA_ID=CAMNT_0004611641 /DNA_START=68 /DNA_END=385 /DNA_ORIENTATION=+